MVLIAFRLITGVVILLIVDLIWVASSQLTEYLYHDKSYNKPFFSTYIKTCMFMVYFVGFLFWKPWRSQCVTLVRKRNHHDHTNNINATSTSSPNSSPLYSVLEQLDDHEHIEDTLSDNEINSSAVNEIEEEYEPVLSEPIWVPVKFNDMSSEKSSGTESDGDGKTSIYSKTNGKLAKSKSVHFKKLTEVRQMSNFEADEALMSRLSYQATIRAQQVDYLNVNRLNLQQTAKLSLSFCLLWFAGNLSYQIALNYSEAGLVNVLSSTSSLFTLIFACIFPSISSSDRFSLSKLLSVVMSVGCVAIISTTDSKLTANSIPLGALWALSGAVFYASYIVMLRHKIDNEDTIDMPMFFGFVGLFNCLLIWPGLFILHYSQLEPFQWPDIEQWCILLVNGLIGTVFSELLWLWGCFLTSSLMASLSISLTIPLTIMCDVLLKNIEYPRLFFLGTIPLFVCFILVTILSHYNNWDPIATLLHKLVHSMISRRSPLVRVRERVEDEQSQSLIDENA